MSSHKVVQVMDFFIGELPAKGLRAWAQDGLKRHGLNNTNIPPETGGTIVFQNEEGTIFAVQWDLGAITMHSSCDFARDLICIGTHQTLAQYWIEQQSETSHDDY